MSVMAELADTVAKAWRESILWIQHDIQIDKASKTLKQGFGVMCCLGDFESCDLVFPRYKLAVRYREGDILLADVANQVHGNTPLLNPDGTVPNLGQEPERLVCVFYYREQMEFCKRPDEEMEVINNWKKGQSTRAKKKKKS